MKHARWAVRAQTDLANVDDHYHALDPDYASRVGRKAIEAARFLAENPHAGPLMSRDLRKWRVNGTLYVLVYRIVTDGVEIARLHHGHENWRTD